MASDDLVIIERELVKCGQPDKDGDVFVYDGIAKGVKFDGLRTGMLRHGIYTSMNGWPICGMPEPKMTSKDWLRLKQALFRVANHQLTQQMKNGETIEMSTGFNGSVTIGDGPPIPVESVEWSGSKCDITPVPGSLADTIIKRFQSKITNELANAFDFPQENPPQPLGVFTPTGQMQVPAELLEDSFDAIAAAAAHASINEQRAIAGLPPLAEGDSIYTKSSKSRAGEVAPNDAAVLPSNRKRKIDLSDE